jgi:hypothetical protein
MDSSLVCGACLTQVAAVQHAGCCLQYSWHSPAMWWAGAAVSQAKEAVLLVVHATHIHSRPPTDSVLCLTDTSWVYNRLDTALHALLAPAHLEQLVVDAGGTSLPGHRVLALVSEPSGAGRDEGLHVKRRT